MILERVNLQQKLEKHRDSTTSQQEILEQIKNFIATKSRDEAILEQLEKEKQQKTTSFNSDLLEANRIFHISHIEKLCTDYRLRFLPTRFFKGKIPAEAISAIKQLEKEHDTALKGFHIMAPSKNFRLENADDPLLFASMGNDYFYLVQKWGQDLHPLRKLMVWPLKNIENLLIFTILFSFLFTFVFRELFFARYQATSEFLMLFLFTFKSSVALLVFYGVALGKNFNGGIWNSKHYNA